MEATGKIKKRPRFFKAYTPRSKDFYAGMPTTEPGSIIFEQPRSDYAKEAVIFQRFCDELSAAPDDESVIDHLIQRLSAELFAASNDGSVSSFKNTPQFGSPALSETPPALKEVTLDLACYGGYKFPYGNLGEASAADAPAPSGQVGITTGYPKSIDISVVPVREVAALNIGEK